MRASKPLAQQIKALKYLPTLPPVLLQLTAAWNRDGEGQKNVASILGKDPLLCNKILRCVNSAYAGLSHKVETIEQAVAIIGGDGIKNIAVCTSVFEIFETLEENKIFSTRHFWWHAIRCAALSKLIAKTAGYGQPDDAYLSGLLHDMGKLVLWTNFPEQFREPLEYYKEYHAAFLAGEIQLGMSHAEIGAWLLQRWNFPSYMADSVRYHHEPPDRISTALPLTRIVYVANAISQPPSVRQAGGMKSAEDMFGFSATVLNKLLEDSDMEIKKAAECFEIEIESPGGFEGRFDASPILGACKNLLGASDQDDILQVTREILEILFDIKDVFFFLYNTENGSLMGKIFMGEDKFTTIEDLCVPLKMEKSLLIQTLRQGKALSSFAFSPASPPVISDEQIIRFIGKEGVLCLPMVAYGEYVGVIVLGMDEIEFSHLRERMNPLTAFISCVGVPLYVDRLRQNHIRKKEIQRNPVVN